MAGTATAIDTRELARLARLSRLWSRNGAGVAPASFDGLLNATGVTKGASRTSTAVDEATAKELLADLDGSPQSLNLDRKNPRGKEDLTHLPPEQLVESILQKEQHIAEIMRNIKKLLVKHGT